MHEIREDLTENVSAILLGYRNKCAASTAVSQACSRPISVFLGLFSNALAVNSPRLLPHNACLDFRYPQVEAHQRLALCDNSLSLLMGNLVGNVNSDVRNYYSHRLMSTSVRQVIEYLYPPLIALHDLDATAAVPDPVTANLTIPSPMKNTYQQMNAGGVYLIGDVYSYLQCLLT